MTEFTTTHRKYTSHNIVNSKVKLINSEEYKENRRNISLFDDVIEYQSETVGKTESPTIMKIEIEHVINQHKAIFTHKY